MSKSGTDPAHISFRISNPAVAEELATRAQAAGMSPNLLARELLTEALSRSDRTSQQLYELESTLAEISTRVTQLDTIEQHLLRGIHMLLRYGGKLEAPQAKMVMQKYFTAEAQEPGVDAVNQEDGAGE